jgi:multidrug efflux pump subunit AcrB
VSEFTKGPIAWMARNPVAANLLMFVILAGGALGLASVKQEVFPEFDLDVVRITVPYPGASPAEVEQGIILAVEEAVRGIDGVKHVNSVAAEGAGTVAVELLVGADPDKTVADIKSEVDRIRTFPEEAEDPTVALVSRKRVVIRVVISGDQELATLHGLAEQFRNKLLDDPAITQVDVFGVRDLEVSIEIPRQTLESYGLSLDDVARQVTASSIELPGGGLETRGGELLVRVSDRKTSATEFEDIVLKGTRGGAEVRLGDIATVQDGYADTDQGTWWDGKPAVEIVAYRVGKETPTAVADATRSVMQDFAATLPATIGMAVAEDDSEMLRGRIDLLMNNAKWGGLLVILILAMFLEIRLAGWVALGIPTSFMGAFLLMGFLGLSVNMITLFAFIITLGMVVDDAIIVGENAHQRQQDGQDPLEAAIAGAREMVVPVGFAILSSIVAFSPLFFVPGTMGKIFRMIPAIVCLVLAFSWIESFFVLPAHLSHGSPKTGGIIDHIDRVQGRIARALQWHIDRVYKPILEATLRRRYAALAIATALFILTIGAVAAGYVPFNFFPKLEGNNVVATVRMPYGAPVELTQRVQQELEAAANRALAELGAPEIRRGMLSRLAEGPMAGGPGGGTSEKGSHLAAVELKLVPSEERTLTSAQVADAWRKQVPPLAGVEALTISGASGPGSGAAVDVQLTHPDTAVLAAASEELTETLRSYDELTNVSNSYSSGKPQLDFQLLPQARSLGLTSAEIARQLRSAFYGAEALREQRGRNEVKVMVRLPEAQRRSEFDLEEFLVRTPRGGDVPLSYVASFERGRAPTSIPREDGRRTIDVEGELAGGVASPQKVLENLTTDVLPDMMRRYDGLSWSLVGSQRAQADSMASLKANFALAMFIIFGLIAVPFRSYIQPIIVMVAIPFGIVGAVWGHVVMGYSMSIISMMGIVALSGVAVNDSLVLVDATNKFRAEGSSAWDAIILGGTRRFRPILLTSLTTFFGLAPMILETSVQARFLIPMAISLGFGVLFATFIALLIVPALYLIVEDVRMLLDLPDPHAVAAPEGAPLPA